MKWKLKIPARMKIKSSNNEQKQSENLESW